MNESIYSQLDPRWNRVTLGNTRYTINDWGCTITSICRLAFLLNGENYTPDQLAKMLLFDAEGRLFWTSLEKIGLRARRIKNTPTSEIYEKFKGSLLIELNYRPRHWVSFEELNTFGTLKVMDPLPGGFVSKKQSEVCGYAIIESTKKKDINMDPVPDWKNVVGKRSAKDIWDTAKKKGYVSNETKFNDEKKAGELMIYLARMFPEKF